MRAAAVNERWMSRYCGRQVHAESNRLRHGPAIDVTLMMIITMESADTNRHECASTHLPVSEPWPGDEIFDPTRRLRQEYGSRPLKIRGAATAAAALTRLPADPQRRTRRLRPV